MSACSTAGACRITAFSTRRAPSGIGGGSRRFFPKRSADAISPSPSSEAAHLTSIDVQTSRFGANDNSIGNDSWYDAVGGVLLRGLVIGASHETPEDRRTRRRRRNRTLRNPQNEPP